MRTELKQLHRELGTTTIYVTHDQEEALVLGDRVVVVREGRIQQTGTPREVYRHPVNRFVGGFLGAAPMNFLEGTVVEDEGRLWFDEGAQRVVVPEWAAEDLRGKVGGKVVLGIRPELLRCEPVEGQGHNGLDVRVKGVESPGDKIDVRLSTGHHAGLVARLESRAVPDAAGLNRVYVDLDRVHFFEVGEGGRNLCLAAERRVD
jgi:multiple sugar transport system ATP-binding protein